jgi:hypothetical protein
MSAVKNGNLECLKYAHENGCPWDEYTCNYAVESEHLECLKYAYENGCPCDKEKIYILAKENNHLDCLEYINDNIINVN